MSTGPIGQNFQILSRVDSTNNYAMAQVQKGAAQHGDTWFALEQTAGRGRRNRTWTTTPGENIVLTTVLTPRELLPTDQFTLSVAVALACYDLLAGFIPEKISIKWPNDLYWNDRKAGGILIENVLHGSHWSHAVVGIGINVNETHFPPELKNPVSLKQIIGHGLDVLVLARELCKLLEMRYRQLLHEGAERLWHQYHQVLYKNGQSVKFKRNNILFHATVQGVDKQGRLMVLGGVPELLQAGEVEWLFP